MSHLSVYIIGYLSVDKPLGSRQDISHGQCPVHCIVLRHLTPLQGTTLEALVQ